MTKTRVLIFGFSNVATTLGFSTRLIEKMGLSCPEVDIVRVGLGALQPHVVPAFLRMASERLGPFSHVLFEINTSAFALHPLSTEHLGRELLLDILHTVRELRAQPMFVMLYRDWQGKSTLDFNRLTRELCDAVNIPVLDLADALVAEKGQDFVQGLLRDTTHTNEEGAAFQGAKVHDFLVKVLDTTQHPDLWTLDLPDWRRSALELPCLADTLPQSTVDCSGLTQSYATFGATDDCTIALNEPVRAMGLSFLYHTAGGHADILVNDNPKPLRLTSIDPFSYFTRIGVLPFDFFRGTDLCRLHIKAPADAPEITLLKSEKTRPLQNLIGTLLVMRPT